MISTLNTRFSQSRQQALPLMVFSTNYFQHSRGVSHYYMPASKLNFTIPSGGVQIFPTLLLMQNSLPSLYRLLRYSRMIGSISLAPRFVYFSTSITCKILKLYSLKSLQTYITMNVISIVGSN